ncbi:patatin-like phospholipase family protein [uncultured Nocardioides sp.]|uniref:patatin-like phospholipase family protein n=1 Tax=uncultured Nocardioides sp. TaxID=198441 RepID=UPI0026033164|nr:patatin-like phospholipase family protein [uncultured Nocardioides sp.]
MTTTVQDQARTAELRERDTYLGAGLLECDIVMKGGITSGVLYPLAVCELATRYRMRSVGGTSAGAIAAAAAAAAEVGRRSDRAGSGFDGLARLPEWLGTDEHLLGLFRPPRATRREHALLMQMVRPGATVVGKIAALLGSGLFSRRWWLPALGALPGLILLVALAVGAKGSPLTWVALVVAVLLAVLGLALGALAAVLVSGGRALTENHYGIVAGSRSVDGEDSLSDWLADRLDELAGIGHTDAGLLTFGDLRGAGVNLEMMTTNVTEGRPYRLPGDLGGRFYFDEEQFRLFFPDRVVDHLIAHAPGERTPTGLVPLPPADLLPVVVATRMSLSFPVLLSAVPLYTVDRSRLTCRPETYERSWFSDGGIASNFPISFFDSLLPSRPTFGINLRPFHECHPISDDERRNVWMPRTNGGGILEWWAHWPEDKGLRSLGMFLWSIVRTMQNWVDNTQTRVPGYRDRIVHISHTDAEGGMNLAMPPDVLDRLTERGRCAGERLWTYYTTPPGEPLPVEALDALDRAEAAPRAVSWENHRWVRLRSSLALVSDAVDSMSDALQERYAADLDAELGAAPGYRFTNLDQRELAQSLASGLRRLADDCDAIEARGPNVPLRVGAPSPAPSLRIAPGVRQQD